MRRGILPKITRRLRDDERKQIASGTIFVFDEQESSIKRWTDGMIWSPSRILNNFLVYREVEKKDLKPASDQPAFASSHSGFGMPGVSNDMAAHSSVRSVPLTLMSNSMDADAQLVPYRQEHTGYHALDVVPSSSHALYTDQDGFLGNQSYQYQSAQAHTQPQAAGMVGMLDNGAASSSAAAKREAELDRTIVGSLTSSYPFVRDGLCKKTISIQVEGSTQHLISYYKIDDVHNNRLTTPSSLPEISSLVISPIFLNKSNFRYPPIVEFGPDKIPRYIAEATDNTTRSSGNLSSGGESYSSSDARHDGLARAASRSLTIYSPGMPSDTAHNDLHNQRYPHQIGGDGMLPMSATLPLSASRGRRTSDAPRRRANTRYEPYQSSAAFGHGMVPHQLYTSTPGVEDGALSPSGRRVNLPGGRAFGDAESLYHSDPRSLTMQRLQNEGVPGTPHFAQPSSVVAGQPSTPVDAQFSPMHHVDQHGSFQQSFPPGSMMPFVPSQPARSQAGYVMGVDYMQNRSEVPMVKQEQGDPFHFSSSRLARGSWDSNQPNHAGSFFHHMQQPPATSQGLTPMPVHSQANFSGPIYTRQAGSPPNTSSSHDSRHSYFGNGTLQATGRIDEVGGNSRSYEDASYASRPISRAGEGGYAGGLDSAGMVRNRMSEALQTPSNPASPYPRPQPQQHRSQQQYMSSNDVSGYDSYDRPSSAVDGHQSLYAQQASHASAEHEVDQLNQQTFDRSAQSNEQAWSSSIVPDGNGGMEAPRPGTSPEQSYRQQQSFEDGDNDAAGTNDGGLERVMLTRPAS